MGLLKRLSNKNKKHIKRLRVKALAIDALKDEMAALTDEQLKAKTQYFKDLIQKEETLEKQNEVLSKVYFATTTTCALLQ